MEILSERLRSLSESETLAMTRKSRELRDQGVDVINLSIGEPDFNTPGFIKDAAIQAIHDNHTHYAPVSGYCELREAIAEKLSRDNQLKYSPDQVVVSGHQYIYQGYGQYQGQQAQNNRFCQELGDELCSPGSHHFP